MSDNILMDGDEAQIVSTVSNATVIQPQLHLTSSTNVFIGKRSICVLSGATLAEDGSVNYSQGAFQTGNGTLKVKSINAGPANAKVLVNGQPVLVKSMDFDTEFSPVMQAMQPTAAGPIPDPVPVYQGRAQFSTKNNSVFVGG
ncbi:MAG: hypothetical protein HRT35_29330 [Algicola sp.]|nr:hypothetical protein [Algicola sp.]